MKLFIDDLRNPPDDSWYVAKTSHAAIQLIKLNLEFGGTLESVAFDHDLGMVPNVRELVSSFGFTEDTTRPVMLWLIENEVWPHEVSIHTGSPVGFDWLMGMAKRYFPNYAEITDTRRSVSIM